MSMVLEFMEHGVLALSGAAIIYFGLLLQRVARHLLHRLGALLFVLTGTFGFFPNLGLLIVQEKSGGVVFEMAENLFMVTAAGAILLYISGSVRLHSDSLSAYQAQALRAARDAAENDFITGLRNHRSFQKRLDEEMVRSRRYNRSLSLLMIDLDHFRTLNDSYGHTVGDAVLREVSRLIQQGLRTIDVAARYGGEEFAVILPETALEEAQVVADRLRNSVLYHVFDLPNGHRAFISISIGVANHPIDAQEKDGLIETAMRALSFAKQNGRNRIGLHHEMLKSGMGKDQHLLEGMLRDSKLDEIRAVGLAVDAKTPYTFGHTDQVVRLAMKFAKILQLSPKEIESLRIASLLHNIGLINASENVMNKPGALTLEERKIIQAHPMLAEMLLKDAPQLDGVLPAILYHHERWDGNGYPKGLKGEDIPYLARVLAIAESYHAMISARPYRRKLTDAEAIEELNRNAGTQFDPRLVKLFLEILERKT
jgi:diguanylate cyclase (GGDEF)-like protein